MKDEDYAAIAASLDRALAVFEGHPARFGRDHELYEQLKMIQRQIHAAQSRDLPPDGSRRAAA